MEVLGQHNVHTHLQLEMRSITDDFKQVSSSWHVSSWHWSIGPQMFLEIFLVVWFQGHARTESHPCIQVDHQNNIHR